jgi:hypothetical protein
MPDISMCSGSFGAYICPNKDTCYRHTAEPNPLRQSYFGTLPYDKDAGYCDYYWPDKSNKKQEPEDDKI